MLIPGKITYLYTDGLVHAFLLFLLHRWAVIILIYETKQLWVLSMIDTSCRLTMSPSRPNAVATIIPLLLSKPAALLLFQQRIARFLERVSLIKGRKKAPARLKMTDGDTRVFPTLKYSLFSHI